MRRRRTSPGWFHAVPIWRWWTFFWAFLTALPSGKRNNKTEERNSPADLVKGPGLNWKWINLFNERKSVQWKKECTSNTRFYFRRKQSAPRPHSKQAITHARMRRTRPSPFSFLPFPSVYFNNCMFLCHLNLQRVILQAEELAPSTYIQFYLFLSALLCAHTHNLLANW